MRGNALVMIMIGVTGILIGLSWAVDSSKGTGQRLIGVLGLIGGIVMVLLHVWRHFKST